MTCWRRLAEWHEAGVWAALHEVLLARLRAADELDWSRAVVDSLPRPGAQGGPKRARARSTAARPGSKHHLITDASGIPLAGR